MTDIIDLPRRIEAMSNDDVIRERLLSIIGAGDFEHSRQIAVETLEDPDRG